MTRRIFFVDYCVALLWTRGICQISCNKNLHNAGLTGSHWLSTRNDGNLLMHNLWEKTGSKKGQRPQGADPTPFLYAREGSFKSFERGNWPPPPHWDWRVIQPNHIKFRTCSALAPMWIPPINQSAELTRGGPLVNSELWGLNQCSQAGRYDSCLFQLIWLSRLN